MVRVRAVLVQLFEVQGQVLNLLRGKELPNDIRWLHNSNGYNVPAMTQHDRGQTLTAVCGQWRIVAYCFAALS